MDEDVAATDLAQEEALNSVVEKLNIVVRSNTVPVQEDPQQDVLQTCH